MCADSVKPMSSPLPRPLVAYRPHTIRRYSGPAAMAFSPDGSTLAFVSPKDGPAVVCEAPLAGGEPPTLFSIEGAAVHGISWSPTGDLYCTAHRGGTEQWQIYAYRLGGKIDGLAVSDGDRVQHHLSQDAVSPDGRSVAISTNARQPEDVDVAIVDTQTLGQRLVVSGPTWHVVGGWSPDGHWLSVMRVALNTDQDLLAVEVDSGRLTELTPHEGEVQNVPAGWLEDGRLLVITDRDSDFLHLETIDIRKGEHHMYDQARWDVELATTSTDGRGVVWSVNEDGYSRLRWRFRSGLAGDFLRDGTVGEIVLSHDGVRCAYTLLPIGGPVEIRTLELTTGEDRLVIRGEALPYYPPRPESIRFAGTEGDIPCYIYRPDRGAGRVPALMFIHGGPEGQSRPQFMSTAPPPVAALVARLLKKGVAIVIPNIHGSTGYGKAWQARIHRDWGGIDLADLRSVAEWMRAQPDFDPDRFGVFGGSYGGFATLMCVTRLPEYWCCAVDIFGPSNLVTMLENTPPNWRRWTKRGLGDLDTDREKLVERSPITHVQNVRCPLLVIQGDNDPRVPREESDQMVERLRGLGRPVEYITFEAEGHGFARRESEILTHERTTEFLERNLFRR